MARHLRGAPIRLTCHAAEVATAGRGEVDADVMTAGIINEGGAHAIPEIAGEGLARGGAGLQLLTVNIRVTSLSSSYQGGDSSSGDRCKCKRLHRLALAFVSFMYVGIPIRRFCLRRYCVRDARRHRHVKSKVTHLSRLPCLPSTSMQPSSFQGRK